MKRLTDSLYYCGVLDPDLEVFDIRHADGVRHYI